MDQPLYDKLTQEAGAVGLVRPFWTETERAYHEDLWKERSITVLICQRKTPDLIRLCLESLLKFYPDIPVLVVDGNSADDSLLYLKLKSIMYPNVTVWNRVGRHSHGDTMHEAIMNHITTRYVLTMDSDIITERGGFIEEMLEQFEHNPKLYATGTLLLVTRSNYGCGKPKNENDSLRYSHPSLSLMHVETYKTLTPFKDHGAPSIFNMMDAEETGLHIGAYPIDNYVTHLSGASWVVPRTVWCDDHDVMIRPFVTFIVTLPAQLGKLRSQTDHDFDIVLYAHHKMETVVMHDDRIPVTVSNYLYGIRFKVTGEYVIYLNEDLIELDTNYVNLVKQAVIADEAKSERLNVGGVIAVKRKVWQRKDALQ